MNATTPTAFVRPAPADDIGNQPVDTTTSPRFTSRLRPRHALWGIGLLLLVAAAVWGSHYWAVGRFIESTDDAYVKADSTTVAPKVSGYIAQVLVDDNQPVKAGQVVALIDARDLQTASGEADASLAATAAVVANLTAQLTAQDDMIHEAQADLQVGQTAVELARRNDSRRREMAKVGFGSDEQSDEASTDLRQKTAGVTREEAALASARQQVEVL
jgi:membrane fusion protein (multidrug efflux system)